MDPRVKIKRTNFYVGLPAEADAGKIADFKATGGNIIWIISPEETSRFSCPYGDLAAEWKDDMDLKTFLFDHLNKEKGGEVWSADPSSERFEKFVRMMIDISELHTFDAHSSKVLSKDNLPFRNGLRNFRWVEDGIPLSRLKDFAVKHKSAAIIVAAGPSLNSQWTHLKRIHPTPNSNCIITVGRSYAMLMKHGVCPEFVVEAEQYDWNAGMWYFAPPPPPFTTLCAPLSVTPKIMSGWPGQKCILLDHPTAEALGMKINVDSIDGGNSVAHLAFNLAVRLGCNPIYLAGVDLGYPKGSGEDTHANGTFHQGWGQSIISNEHMFQGDIQVPANDGGTVQSSQPYVNFKTFFELMVAKSRKEKPDLKVYTFSKRGQKITGVEYLELETWDGTSPSPSSSPSSPPLESASSVSSVGVPFPSGSPVSTSGTPPTP